MTTRTWPAPLQGVIEAEATVSHVVIGAAGSGKTTLLIERARHLVARGLHPDAIRLLTPSRAQATRLRDELARAIPVATRGPFAQSVASLAFSIVTADHISQGLPVPTLRSGADVDEDIRSVLEGWGDDSPFSGWLDPVVYQTETFRTELRELMARVIEHGHTTDDLARWGKTHNRPEWVKAAAFMAEYQRVIARSRPHSFEPAELITRAARIVAAGLPEEGGDLRVILVDDLHDVPASARTLISQFARRGISVTAVGDPDSAGQTFRGSDPEAPAQLASELGVEPIFAHRVYRHGAAIRDRVAALSMRVGASRAGQQRRVDTPVGNPEGSVSHLLSTSATEEHQAIAQYVSSMHVRSGIPLDQFAVISRQAGAGSGIARALAQVDIPSYLSTRLPLSEEPAVRDLLWWVRAASRPDLVTFDQARQLLTGVYGQWTPLEMRRLASWIRVREAQAGTGRHWLEVARDLVCGSDVFVDAPASLAGKIDRIIRLVAAVKKRGTEIPLDVLLSGTWQELGVENSWRESALGHGEGAGFAARCLDAVVALTETASRFASSHPGVGPEVFISRILAQDVAEDVIVHEPVTPAVWLGTPSSAAGRQWQVVIIQGLNDGVWPNVRLRGGLLGAPHVAWKSQGIDPATVDARRVVLDDEIRMAILAASRATSQLVVSAVSSEDVSPSPLWEILAQDTPRWLPEADQTMNLRHRVGALRHTLVTGSPREVESSSNQLAYLAHRGVYGANPDTWWGLLEPSSTAPLFLGEVVRVSPSRMSVVEQSPLMWFLDTVAPEPLPPVVSVGAIVHRALEDNPWGPLEALAAVVDQLWSQVSFESAWLSDASRKEAHRQLHALQAYLEERAREGVELVAAEKRFELMVNGALISGVMDRVEKDTNGVFWVVDLKTGAHKTTPQVADDPQLLAYQLALTSEEGAVEAGVGADDNGGAYLLFVSSGLGGKPFRLAIQPPVTDQGREAFRERIGEVRDLMASAEFIRGEVGSVGNSKTPRHRWHLIGQVCGDD